MIWEVFPAWNPMESRVLGGHQPLSLLLWRRGTKGQGRTAPAAAQPQKLLLFEDNKHLSVAHLSRGEATLLEQPHSKGTPRFGTSRS